MSLKNKVAIVTGGNSGIGQAIVLELARQGASIVIDYVVHPEATEKLEQQIAKLGSQCSGVEADVSKVAELQKMVDAAVKTFGRLDIMVNNAGMETRTSTLDTTEHQFDLVIAVDTSIVHLAGAMGRPVWALLASAPDWRWMLNREDSPWYPTVRILRQSQTGSWNQVVEGLKKLVSQLIRPTPIIDANFRDRK